MPRPIAYIAQIEEPSPRLLAKIHEKHNITLPEVKEAVVLCEVLSSVWHFDPDPARGWRLLVTGLTYLQRQLNVVLYPVDQEEGIWRLGTAMPDDSA